MPGINHKEKSKNIQQQIIFLPSSQYIHQHKIGQLMSKNSEKLIISRNDKGIQVENARHPGQKLQKPSIEIHIQKSKP